MLEFMSCDIKSWIKLNLTQPHRFAIDIADWDLMFGGVCWFIWLRRNDLVFNAGHEEEVRQPVLDRARRWLASAVAAQGAADALQHLPSQGGRELVSWSPPPHGWVKLNTDAARVDQNGYMSCGGLARDEHGSWMDLTLDLRLGCCKTIGTTIKIYRFTNEMVSKDIGW
ncbi:hypothetical protein V6N11_013184 [Hibiscus sabdariffa]|uniref:RNase H type-1 domain-containing protein n=1 Tax=Hibiscus sabdariffa TaxID=183260 RepID=A0ABR2NF75_9ROSI